MKEIKERFTQVPSSFAALLFRCERPPSQSPIQPFTCKIHTEAGEGIVGVFWRNVTTRPSFLATTRGKQEEHETRCASVCLGVDACALCLGECFRRAWTGSAWQELTPERSACLHVCVLHECSSVCVWTQTGTCTRAETSQLVCLGCT